MLVLKICPFQLCVLSKALVQTVAKINYICISRAFPKSEKYVSKSLILLFVRIGLFFTDHEIIRTNIEKAKEMLDEGGDWDRRNRLKVDILMLFFAAVVMTFCSNLMVICTRVGRKIQVDILLLFCVLLLLSCFYIASD